jgi:UDP-N-acetylmuramoyl-tripeptide--D-alanyl-D-alanine ligase
LQKLQLAKSLSPAGAIILNRNLPLFDEIVAEIGNRHRIITFGESQDADFRLRSIEPAEKGQIIDATARGRRLRYAIRPIGRFMAVNSLAALAAANEIGIALDDAAQRLGSFEAAPGRARVFRLRLADREITVLDDSFNATPLSVRSSLSLLGGLIPSGDGRRVAVLGNIAHLGKDSPQLHAALAEQVLENRVDRLYTFGSLMRHLRDAVPREIAAGHFTSREALMAALLADIQAGDVIAVKASMPSRFHEIVRGLRRVASGSDSDSRQVEGTLTGASAL